MCATSSRSHAFSKGAHHKITYPLSKGAYRTCAHRINQSTNAAYCCAMEISKGEYLC